MITIPVMPLDTNVRAWLDFCLDFRTVAGFVNVFEEKWKGLGGQVEAMGSAYEATELLYNHLFGRRRYCDRESFYSARSRYYSQ